MLTTIEKSLDKSQLQDMKGFGGSINKFGINFAVCDSDGKLVLLCEGEKFKSSRESIIDNCLSAIKENCECGKQKTCRLSTIDNRFIVAVLKCGPDVLSFAALIDLGVMPAVDSTRTDSEYLGQMLRLFVEKFQVTAKAEAEIEVVSAELSQVYEELVLLHKLSTNMKVNTSDAGFLQMACDSLTEIVSVEGIAILLEKTIEEKKQFVLAAGSGLIDVDCYMADVLHGRLEKQLNLGKEALLDSEVDSPFRYSWEDNIKNIIVVPLFCKDKTATGFEEVVQSSNRIIGMMVAINRIDRPDFDSTDVKLFNSVANGCAVFVENGRLFSDLKELFIGSLKALTNSIDAKDQYTHGHSERVAFISRWIAERLSEKMPLEEEQIHRIYLAGLLHDIGKVGIDEAVLRKKGRLTKEEFNRIRAHSAIGAGILSAIKQMQDIVPGVLCHHERIDGKGYPNGLTGEQISLIGKIVGLADSFDAMTSKRTYRDAMSVEQALEEVKKGLGTQFDEQVGKVFLNSDVYRLWEIIQDGFSETYGMRDFSEYGTIAVGTLIK
ncbi:MAG: HD domain-containing phosphohydrolase [Planctomycetota bacterium]|jgi:HD-GYP domain-containing protein (c-di-GMP phosphodiesterase class II)